MKMRKEREKEREYSWFVESLDSHTNAVLARELPEEDLKEGILCADGRHNLWQCPWNFVAKLMRSKRDLGLKFTIFNQEGNGKIRESLFLRKRRRRRVLVRQ